MARFTLQFDEGVIDRQAVEARAVKRAECFEMFQRVHLFKYSCVAGKRRWGVEAACTAAACLFTMAGVRRGIGTEERAGEPAGDQLTQRLLVDVALEDRQTVEVRAHPAHQHVVTVKHQVLWRNGGGDEIVAVTHVLCRVFGGDMLKDHLQRGQALAQRLHHGLDKTGFTVEDVNVSMRHFTVNQQRHTQFLHAFQNRHDGINAGDAVAGVGGGICRVEFRCRKHAFVKAALHFVRIQ